MHPALYRKLKILSIIGASLLLSNQIDNTFFIAHSPTVNMAAVERLTHPEVPAIDTQYIAAFFNRSTAQSISPLQAIEQPRQVAEVPALQKNLENTAPPLVSLPTPTTTPTAASKNIDFVANSSVGDQKSLLRSNGFTEVSANVFYKNDGVVEEIVLPPAVQYGSSTATGEDGGEITVLSPL